MVKKLLYGLWLIVSIAALIVLTPKLYPQENTPEELFILRVWNAEKEPALAAFLRKQAAVYEKKTGVRIYIRSVSEKEAAALKTSTDALLPDLLFSSEGKTTAALLGYALFVRDEAAEQITPVPTGALFHRPSPTPGPTQEPQPWPEAETLSAVLSSQALMGVLPGTVFSAQPTGDFQQGKAGAALLTAGQAAQLTVGYRVYALPDGKGFVSLQAEAFSENGEQFLTFLLSDESQQVLRSVGLFSPRLRLYQADDPIRFLIDASRSAVQENAAQ